ncbi:hypothetical protein JCM8547_001134 [Rhodosporidiobolus lusitaniae]
MPSASALTVTPLDTPAGFGASVEGIDLNNLSEPEFLSLQHALYTHKVLVIRNQRDLDPRKHQDLVQRFDPKAEAVHGHGNAKEVQKTFKGKKSLVGANPPVPSAPMVRMIGRAVIPPGYHGSTEEIVLKSSSHKPIHKEPLSDEEIEKGLSRFQRWHIDAALYRTHPPRVTALWAHKLPSGPPVRVEWDLSLPSGPQSLLTQPGRTAYLDSFALFSSLSPADKAWVEWSEVEYAPHPFQWIQEGKMDDAGWGMASEGKETPLEELPEVEEEHVKRYRMVWPSPLTGALALQVHAVVARRLFIRSSPDSDFKVVDDVKEVREILYKLQKPFLKPENVLVVPQEEGDLVLWHNRGVRHTAIEYPSSGDTRIMHQIHIAGSDDPGNPVMLS